LGLKEFKAHAWLTEYLVSKGFSIGKSAAPELETAFIAQFGDPASKLVIGLCSEV
jgi:metal-dependent amidase/aminoacylase/carboxypeptidase family protein